MIYENVFFWLGLGIPIGIILILIEKKYKKEVKK